MQSRFIILKAEDMGMCFGVKDAIRLAQGKSQVMDLTILGQLVHNRAVVRELEAAGIHSRASLEDVTTPAVMISAHGISDRRRVEVGASGRVVLDATCPLVRYAHRSALQLERLGFFPVVVGQPGHVEVKGLTEDLAEYRVVLSRLDVEALPEKCRFGFMAQTTQPVDRLLDLAAHCRRSFPHSEVRVIDTVCQPTKSRQLAAIALAQQSDAVVVVGGETSNNTRELVATCLRFCSKVCRVTEVADLVPGWFEGVRVVGITAGTSTPASSIEVILQRLREMAECSVRK
jgi:4-hydroxy-3-methylbut-2-en-1-yl diphosphate reductase